ncbi:DUF5988 family protein, partial [Streptomyces sp. 2MCAF27]
MHEEKRMSFVGRTTLTPHDPARLGWTSRSGLGRADRDDLESRPCRALWKPFASTGYVARRHAFASCQPSLECIAKGLQSPMYASAPNVILRGGPMQPADQSCMQYVDDTESILKLLVGNAYEHFQPT